MPENVSRGWWFARLILVLPALAVFAVLFDYAREQRRLAQDEKIATIGFTDPVKAALDNNLSSSRNYFQSAMVIGAVLWGLVIRKKDEKRLTGTDLPEVITFCLANLALGTSLYYGHTYSDRVSD